MKMQIPTTNQKTKSIRSASLLAGFGSQGMKMAIAVPAAAATSAIRSICKRAPRRMRAPPSLVEIREPGRNQFAGRTVAPVTPYDSRRDLDGSRCWHLPDRSWRDPDVRGERPHERRQPRHDRLDPDGRRRRRRAAVAHLLVPLGRPRLLVRTPPHHVRGRGAGLLVDRRPQLAIGGGRSAALSL